MKLVSFSAAGGKVRPGALLEEANLVVDLGDAGYADALAVIADGFTVVDKSGACTAHRLNAGRLHAPLAKESGMATPPPPVVFFKLTPAIIGLGEPIVLPRNSNEPDYEAEFAFVI